MLEIGEVERRPLCNSSTIFEATLVDNCIVFDRSGSFLFVLETGMTGDGKVSAKLCKIGFSNWGLGSRGVGGSTMYTSPYGEVLFSILDELARRLLAFETGDR
jgi:hypothetical protein